MVLLLVPVLILQQRQKVQQNKQFSRKHVAAFLFWLNGVYRNQLHNVSTKSIYYEYKTSSIQNLQLKDNIVWYVAGWFLIATPGLEKHQRSKT